MIIHYLPAEKIEQAKSNGTVEESAQKIPAELQALQNLTWLDTSVGLKNSGSVDAYLPLLEIFYTSLDEKSAEIENFYATGDYSNYTIKVHALKSSARIIGAVEFGEDAQLLENAGKSGDLAYIHEHHAAFMRTLQSFKEPLSKIFAGDDSDDKPEADADLMAEVFDAIKSALESQDGETLQEIFAEMSEYRIPQDMAELWTSIKAAVDAGDYVAATALLIHSDD